MEHCLLADPLQIAQQNMLLSYTSLARGVGNTTIHVDEAGTWVTSSHPLSFCHFTAGFSRNSDPARDDKLLQLSNNPNGHWVFVCDGPNPSGLKSHFLNLGFTCRQSLVTMMSTEPGEVTPLLSEALSPEARSDISGFMANQFFLNLGHPSRRLVSRATARSSHRLLTIANPEEITGAMMITDCQDSLGLYNLCVEESYRYQGLGSMLVQSAKELAYRKRIPLILQCQPKLVRWYESLGFSEIGFLHALHRGREKFRDII